MSQRVDLSASSCRNLPPILTPERGKRLTFADTAARVMGGDSITRQGATSLIDYCNLPEIGMLACHVSRRVHPERVVTFANGGALPFAGRDQLSETNPDVPIPNSMRPLGKDELMRSAALLGESGSGEITLYSYGSRRPSLGEWLDLLEAITTRFAAVAPSISTVDIASLCRDGQDLGCLGELKAAGLKGVRGEQVGLRPPVSPEVWLAVHRAVHESGTWSTAACLPGASKTNPVEWLFRIRELQQDTGLFKAFASGAIGVRGLGDPSQPARPIGTATASAFLFLRSLAAARCVLDNIPYFQSSWESQGAKIGEIALQFGANDFGATGLVARGAETIRLTPILSTDEIERLIRDSGHTPWQRSGDFQRLQPDMMSGYRPLALMS